MSRSLRNSIWIGLCALIAGIGSGCHQGPETGAISFAFRRNYVAASSRCDDCHHDRDGDGHCSSRRGISHGQVTSIMNSGVDPHLFKPSRGHIKQLHDADIVFYSGLMLEGRMSETFAEMERSGKSVFAVTESLDKSYLRSASRFCRAL